MVEHSERRSSALNKEFDNWVDNCDALAIIQLVGIDKLKEIWLSNRLKRIKKEIEEREWWD